MTTIIMGIFIRSNYINKITDEQLFERFKQYGFIKNIFRPIDPLKQYCIVRFREKASIQRALAEVHIIGNVKLNCYPEKENGSWHLIGSQLPALVNANLENMAQQVTKEEKPLVEFSRLKITNEMSFDNAVDLLIKDIEAPAVEKSFYSQVCSDLECIFKQELPGVKAVIFGSRLTGLALKNSDLDVFMECPEGQQPAKTFVARKSKVMYKSYLFSNIIRIPRAKVPLIKCVHVPSGIPCDVTFQTKMGVYNSKLLKFLISLDHRLRPLFMLLRHWASSNRMLGLNQFTNFSFSNLVIYYLQTLENPILPSTIYLQNPSICKTNFVYTFENQSWACSFCQNKTKLKPILNKSSVKTLVGGFFRFYSNFNFQQEVLCPFIGETVPKSCFSTILNCPDGKEIENVTGKLTKNQNYLLSLLKQQNVNFNYNSPICIQDPLELSNNIAKQVRSETAEKFIKLCQHYTDCLFDKTDLSNLQILNAIFDQETLQEKVKKNNFKMDLDILMEEIPLPVPSKDFPNLDVYKTYWFAYVKRAILLIFDSIYKFNISQSDLIHKHIVNDLINNNKEPVDAFKNLYFHCKALHAVHMGRTRAGKMVKGENLLYNEIAISDYLVENEKEKVNFETEITMVCFWKTQDPFIKVVINNIYRGKNNSFKGFVGWISSCLRNQIHLAFNSSLCENLKRIKSNQSNLLNNNLNFKETFNSKNGNESSIKLNGYGQIQQSHVIGQIERTANCEKLNTNNKRLGVKYWSNKIKRQRKVQPQRTEETPYERIMAALEKPFQENCNTF